MAQYRADAAAMRTQILANAKFIYSPVKEFEIVTTLSGHDNPRMFQAMLVEIDRSRKFPTHLIADPENTLEEALEKLHCLSMKLVYRKVPKELKADAKLATGEVDTCIKEKLECK